MKNNYVSFYMPSNVYIPFDSIEKLTLRKNGAVYCGEMLGCINENLFIYSTVSGIIRGTQNINVENKLTKVLVIENDYKDKRLKLNGGKERLDLYKRKEANELLDSFNMGGKYNGKKYLSVNLLTNNNDLENKFMLMEKVYEVLETIDALLSIYNLEKAYVVVNSKDCEEYLELYSGIYPNIKFTNKLNQDDKTVVYSGFEILSIYYILKFSKKLCEKFVTIVKNKKEVLVVKTKLNCTVKELLDNLNISFNSISVTFNDNLVINNYDGIITDKIKTINIL